jgi:WD40 repeat protein
MMVSILFMNSFLANIFSILVSNDNRYLISAGADKNIRVWDLFEFELKLDISEAHEGEFESHIRILIDSVFVMAMTSTNRYLISGSKDMRIKIWDLKPKSELVKDMEKAHTSKNKT